MNAVETVSSGVTLPRLASVSVATDLAVNVSWLEGTRAGRSETIDLSPLVGEFRFFAPLRDDPALFATVRLDEDGRAIEWDGGVDMASTSLERLAEEQMTAEDFAAFLRRNKLTRQSAASALGRSLRMIQNYIEGKPIPRIVALACFGYESRAGKRRP